ncbi:NAD-dependent epimerase/dehydratase family protein [Bordetella genomosp. 13]|uniref:NAD(P)-dependent oxidoreductase n=1 Tax=Bordetella genomosp. 13 TaxID=463040 RepID=A0A1W6ZEX0_9BORD|nr:NAD-dependent epimerase/dehydratase family protein [Bordetella genomosp. 13]ARP95847.1 NAD(P)-dependent oxidoreductase [Bordetella genomosp. 13]
MADNERILLVGCGDLGLRTARHLLARGDEVWALRRTPPADAPAGIRWIRADLSRPEQLNDLPGGITRVAWLPAPGRRDPRAYTTVFTDPLPHVFGALDRTMLRRVVFVSSSAVYGDHAGGWVDEHTQPDPPGFNGKVLLQAEQWLADQGLPAAALRLAGLYGPGRTQLLERIRAGQARAPRDSAHWANRMHIDDAAAAVAHLLYLPKVEPVYIGCDDTPLPLHELYDCLATMLNAPPPPEGPPPAGVGSKRLSNARLRASGLTLQWPDSRAGYAALIGAA